MLRVVVGVEGSAAADQLALGTGGTAGCTGNRFGGVAIGGCTARRQALGSRADVREALTSWCCG
jgi:hypothetical protein